MTVAVEPLTSRRRAVAVGPTLHRGLFPNLLYLGSCLIGRMITLVSIRTYITGRENLPAAGPLILASTHLSHLEPFLLSTYLWRFRKIDWVTRIEFFRLRFPHWYLWRIGAFPVNRTGVPVSTFRIALDRLGSERMVGICPEGGVAIGANSGCRGGPLRRGVGLLAYRTGAPVVPVVMIGSHKLNEVAPFIPLRRGQLWIEFGQPIYADRSLDRRESRRQLGELLRQRYMEIYQNMLRRYGLRDQDVP